MISNQLLSIEDSPVAYYLPIQNEYYYDAN